MQGKRPFVAQTVLNQNLKKYCVQAAEVNEVKEVSSLCSLGEVKGQ